MRIVKRLGENTELSTIDRDSTGSFRSEAGATAFCRIRGYVSTVRKQGLDLLASLEATLCGHPILPSFQST